MTTETKAPRVFGIEMRAHAYGWTLELSGLPALFVVGHDYAHGWAVKLGASYLGTVNGPTTAEALGEMIERELSTIASAINEAKRNAGREGEAK